MARILQEVAPQARYNFMTLDIRNVDCMELMKEYPDKYFDLVIVDPPYGIGVCTSSHHTDSNGNRIKNNKQFSDNYLWNENIPSIDYFKELKRVSIKRIIWGANYYNCFEYGSGTIVWNKGEQAKTISQCEIASLSFQKKVDYVNINWQSGFYRSKYENIIHPCQKPVALYEWLLTKYAKKGDKILDTHMGSGSIAIACHNLWFDLVACELDKDYYDAAMNRINNHKKQKPLFNLSEIFIKP